FNASTPTNPIARFFRSIGSAIGVAPPGEKDFIKRVIGIGGDHVACCDVQGRVTVNGVPLTEPYLYPGNTPNENHEPFSVTVPKGHLWVEGDHRGNSSDSRDHATASDGGFVPTHKVIGRAFIKVWPVSHFGILHVPKTFNQKALSSIAGPADSDPALALGLLGAVPIGLPIARLRRRWRSGRSGRARRAPVVP